MGKNSRLSEDRNLLRVVSIISVPEVNHSEKVAKVVIDSQIGYTAKGGMMQQKKK